MPATIGGNYRRTTDFANNGRQFASENTDVLQIFASNDREQLSLRDFQALFALQLSPYGKHDS
jgi:hypothetical protein